MVTSGFRLAGPARRSGPVPARGRMAQAAEHRAARRELSVGFKTPARHPGRRGRGSRRRNCHGGSARRGQRLPLQDVQDSTGWTGSGQIGIHPHAGTCMSVRAIHPPPGAFVSIQYTDQRAATPQPGTEDAAPGAGLARSCVSQMQGRRVGPFVSLPLEESPATALV